MDQSLGTRRITVTAVLVFAIASVVTGWASGADKPTLIDVHPINAANAKGKPARQANCSPDNPTAYTGNFGTTGWVVEGNTTAHLNVSTIPAGLNRDAVRQAIEASYDAWSGGAAPEYTVATDGAVTRYTANGKDDVLFGRTGGSLATTYTWRWQSGLIESDVVFDKGFSWFVFGAEGTGCDTSQGAKYDVANIGTHEAGHVYGLDHAAGSRYETMYAYGYSGETLKRSPATGDVNGINDVYP